MKTYLIIDSINGKTIRQQFIKAADRESAQEAYFDNLLATAVTGDLHISKVAG